ncbi:hypothetical protein AFEL58S_02030 [Afipia felis]
MTMLAACTGLPDSPTRASLQIPRDCENLAEPVPYPPVSKGQNAKASVARHRAALGQANGRLEATRDCQVAQRERFANGF